MDYKPDKIHMSGKWIKIIIWCIILCIFLVYGYLAVTGHFHEHTWIAADCFSPKTCKSCGETVGEPNGHNWIDATCDASKHCDNCGKKQGSALDHVWIDDGIDVASKCQNCGALKPLLLPQNGQIFIGEDLYRESELTIESSTTESCYIKLKGSSGQDVFSFFVRSGDSVTIDVPAGHFYVYFSYGTTWYGVDDLFGPETTYAKDKELCDFENYTWSYTLTPSYGGNFSETPVDADEFKGQSDDSQAEEASVVD